MQAEIISVGTEIILGQITNTNARYLADQLRQLAIEARGKPTLMMTPPASSRPLQPPRNVPI